MSIIMFVFSSAMLGARLQPLLERAILTHG